MFPRPPDLNNSDELLRNQIGPKYKLIDQSITLLRNLRLIFLEKNSINRENFFGQKDNSIKGYF